MKGYLTQAKKDLKKYWYLLILIFFLVMLRIFSVENCLIHLVFKIPCPGCGLTRAYLSLFKGNVIKAFEFHPLFLLPLMALFLFPLRNKKWSIFKNYLLWWIINSLFIICYIIRLSFSLFPF